VDDLATRSRKRRGRGWWIAVLIIVLVAAAGGTGWYFGAGPGANVSIPNVAGDTVSAATTTLTNAGFHPVTAPNGRFDPDPNIAAGNVSGTTPRIGTSVAKGAKVTIIPSKGPAQLPIPILAGLPESQAKSAVRSAKFVVGASIEQFDAKVPNHTVIDFQGSDGTSLLKQKTYSQNRPVTLIVSAGPLPDVGGLSVAAAEAKLLKAGLKSEAGSQAYSPTVQVGDVVQIDPQVNSAGVGRVFRKGDSQQVLLITSRGPEMVLVPNVIGMTWAKAKALLGTQDGFTLSYDHAADALGGNIATVTKVTPGAGQSLIKGSTLTIKFNFNS
jgi:eukaryotic-like serine/threonine-protein kinase